MPNEDPNQGLESMEALKKRNENAHGSIRKSVELLKNQLAKSDETPKSKTPAKTDIARQEKDVKTTNRLPPRLPTVMPEDASKEVQEVYDEFHRRMAFPSPPNFIMTHGHSHAAARGTWDLVRNVLVLGEIPRRIKETIFVAISKDRDCRYCTAAHIACCRMLGVDAVVLDQVMADPKTVSDRRLREMIEFALKCSRNPQSLDEYDFACLRQVGLKQSEIMELIAMSALSVYANIIADATGMEDDEMFGML
jgi:uncharacterized peroxidase-related enzyme